MFQSPISGVNDWNLEGANLKGTDLEGFSLLLAELMIGTKGNADAFWDAQENVSVSY